MSDQPPPNVHASCRNCAAPLGPQAQYCAQCGQRQAERRVSFGTLIGEFFTNFFNVDSQLFRTVRGLFRPGFLSTEYFAGRRKRYASPVRVLLIVTGLLLAVATLVTEWKSDEGVDAQLDEMKRTAAFTTHMELFDSIATDISVATTGTPQLLPPLDTLQRRMWEDSGYYYPDSINGIIIDWSGLYSDDRRIALTDIFYLEADSLIALYGITDPNEQLGARRAQRFVQQGGAVLTYSVGKLFWALLLVIPLMALGLKLLYIRSRHYYVEHLIFLLHWHTWLYLMSIPVLFLMAYLDRCPVWPVLLVLPYLLLAMRQYYGQPWFKTALKLVLLLAAYVLTIYLLLLSWLATSILTF